jgi:MFS family permease
VNSPPIRSRALPALILLALTMASGNIMFGLFSTVQEAAKLELGLSDFELSLLQGVAVSIPLAVLSIPAGFLVDNANRVRLLVAVSLLWTAGTLWTAYAQSVPALFFARMLAGLGASISTTIGISIAADLCLPAQRGRSLMLLTVGKYAGTAGAFALGGWLFGWFGPDGGIASLTPWRSVHLAIGGLSLVLTVLLVFLQEPERKERSASGPVAPRVVAAELWKRRAFLLPLFGGQVGVLMADAAAGIWAAPVLARSFGQTPEMFGGWMGAVIFGSGILGALAGGFSADFGLRSGRRGGVLIGAVIASGLSVPFALFPLAPNVPVFGAALFALLLGGTITGLVTATAIAVVLPNELRGLCIGSFIAIAGLIAFGVSPTLVTSLSALMGGEGELGTALAIIGTVVSILGFASFWLAMRRAPVDDASTYQVALA